MNSANRKADEELRKKLGMVKLDGQSNEMPITQDALILTPRAPVNITSANEVLFSRPNAHISRPIPINPKSQLPSLSNRPISVLALFLRARSKQLLSTLRHKKHAIS